MLKNIIERFINKLSFDQWIIGICRADIKGILSKRRFDEEINWFHTPADRFLADPFLLRTDENIEILLEKYHYREGYGKIDLLTLNKEFKLLEANTVLDTKNHLSYPFTYHENDKYYLLPESAQNDKLSCYEFDNLTNSAKFVKDLIDLPLKDTTILKYNNKYWAFGALGTHETEYTLNIFYSEDILGPYKAHAGNPVKSGIDGIRQAGNFIVENGAIFRPTQNCKNGYGESIMIKKIQILNESEFIEDDYMEIKAGQLRGNNQSISRVHTFNVLNDVVVIDGLYKKFSPVRRVISYFGKRF